MRRLADIPFPFVPSVLGALTLSNIYGSLGFSWLRLAVMACGSAAVLVYLAKIITSPGQVWREYSTTVTSSLYPAFAMCLMVLGSFYYEKGLGFGKALWVTGVAVHFMHIVFFTYRHAVRRVVLGHRQELLMPSWFVTYNGWMCACVTGGQMNAHPFLFAMTVYGCIMYPVLLFFVIRRLLTIPVKDEEYHTLAVLLTPCSFCVISLINECTKPNPVLLGFMFICLLVTIIFVILKMRRFFSFDFHPGYASLTFPLAISTVALRRMGDYLAAAEKAGLSKACFELSGFMIVMTTIVVGYVICMLAYTVKNSVTKDSR